MQIKQNEILQDIFFLTATCLVILGGLLYTKWMPYQDVISFHAILEGFGAFVAFGVIVILLNSQSKIQELSGYFWVVVAFLVMALLNLFHAVLSPGNTSAWFQGMSTLLGGVMISLVWLPERVNHALISKKLMVIATIILLSFCVLSVAVPELIPTMIYQEKFTVTVVNMNCLGGIFYLVATPWFFKQFRLKRDVLNKVFFYVCVLFGMSGILFRYASLWDQMWWLCHGLRALAFGAALWVVFVTYRTANTRLRQALTSLELELSNRKIAEKKLEHLSQEFELILDHLPALVFYKDTDNRFIRVNKYFADAHKVSKKAIEGTNCFDLYPRSQAQAYWDDDLEVIRSRQSKLFIEEPWQTESGFQWLSTCKIPFESENGEVLGVIGMSIDITDRKRAETAIWNLNTRLKASNRELEEFAYVASHDLQEPLRMVVSYLQLFERRYRETLDSDADEFIDYAVDGAKRMQQLINDLLTYSRVTSSQSKSIIPIRCEEILDKACQNLSRLIDETHAEVTHDPLPRILADRVQMLQLIQNLIQNAIKYCENTPRVHVSAVLSEGGGPHCLQTDRTVPKDKAEWIFSVRDNGIGIDPQYFDRIFTVFKRLHARTEYTGTGIGLSLCKKIVMQHGGTIWVESKLGHGSTFYFTMPAAEEGIEATDEAEAMA